MKKFFVILTVIFAQACSDNLPTDPVQIDEGQVSVSLDKNITNSSISFVIITLTHSNYPSITKEFSINDLGLNDIEIPKIPIGIWKATVEIFDKNEQLIFEGNLDIEVSKDGITPINISTNPLSGNLYLDNGRIQQLLNSLVVFYPFINNANDYSGNDLNGNVYGAVLSEDRFGNENNAYHFDGYDDYISIERTKKLQIEGDLTVNVWVNIESFEGVAESIIRLTTDNTDNPGTNALYALSFLDGSNQLTYVHESENGKNHPHTFEHFKFESSIWYNIVIVRDIQSQTVKLYVNGNQQGFFEFSENPSDGIYSYLRIGENHNTVQRERFFHGSIDDIIILDKALTDQEVELLYEFSN